MSTSTRTIQQPLGTGQFWAALAVVTMALAIAVVIAFGSTAATRPAASTLSVGVPPDARGYQGQSSTSNGVSVGVPPDARGYQGAAVNSGSHGPRNSAQ
jgi:hypothetical protein